MLCPTEFVLATALKEFEFSERTTNRLFVYAKKFAAEKNDA